MACVGGGGSRRMILPTRCSNPNLNRAEEETEPSTSAAPAPDPSLPPPATNAAAHRPPATPPFLASTLEGSTGAPPPDDLAEAAGGSPAPPPPPHTPPPPPPPAFASSTRSSHPLRVCCYGSSSSSTPLPYLSEATSLGRILARRGHTCVNGAGSAGCMAAMNDGASEEGGHIVGVIHEMFVVDGSDWTETEGGAHPAFHGGRREILLAGGSDLQERKRLLVEGADALVVLPGGPGTWDELWEMACSRNLGFTDVPIVCVNVNGYYDPFVRMLDRAYRDEMVRTRPRDIVHFEPTSERAVMWIEEETARLRVERAAAAAKAEAERKKEKKAAYRRMDSALTVDRLPPPNARNEARRRDSSTFRRWWGGSVFAMSSWNWSSSRRRSRRSSSRSWVGGKLVETGDSTWSEWAAPFALTFAAGVAVGATIVVATRQRSASR